MEHVAPGGTGLYMRRLQRWIHGTPAQAAKKAAEHGTSHVQIMGAWQQPKKGRGVVTSAPNKRKLRDYAAAMHDQGIRVGLWFYPWAGHEEALLEVLREQCELAQIDFLSNDGELGMKWKIGRKRVRVPAGLNMRGKQPEAIRNIAPAGSRPFVEAAARILVAGMDDLIEDYGMEWGHWFTSYGIARFHPNLPWEIFAKAALVLSPQLYTATTAQVDQGIAEWYARAGIRDVSKIGDLPYMIPSIGTYGKNSGPKMHEHLSSFVDGVEDVDGFVAWSWMQTNSQEWDVLLRWSDWIKRGLCSSGGRLAA